MTSGEVRSTEIARLTYERFSDGDFAQALDQIFGKLWMAMENVLTFRRIFEVVKIPFSGKESSLKNQIFFKAKDNAFRASK